VLAPAVAMGVVLGCGMWGLLVVLVLPMGDGLWLVGTVGLFADVVVVALLPGLPRDVCRRCLRWAGCSVLQPCVLYVGCCC